MHVHFNSPKSGPCQGRNGIGFGERVSVGRPESLILKRFGIFDGESDGVDPHYVVGGLGSVVDDILM